MKKVVAVLFGGKSSEHEISKISASTIISNLSKDKYHVVPIYISKEGSWKIFDAPMQNIFSDNIYDYSTDAIISPDPAHKGIIRIIGDKIDFINIDVIFPVLHGKNGEDGTIQGLLELCGIPYVGCNVLASAIAMDKAYTKVVVDSIGIPQAKYKVFKKSDLNYIDSYADEIEDFLNYPCFIKPASSGSSFGVSKASTKQELIDAITKALEFDTKVIIEEFIDGREVECAVLGNDYVKSSTVGEIKAAACFYDFDAKYNNKESKTIIPAELDKSIISDIREKSEAIFKALNGRGLSRVDFFVENKTNRVIFNEINTLPGFTSISMYPMLWEEMGIKISDLLDKLIELSYQK